MAKAIGTLGTVDSLTIAGRTFTDFTNLKILQGALSNAASNSTPVIMGQSSGYQVPVGKTFRVLALVVQTSLASAANTIVVLGYANNDAGYNSTTAFIGFVGVDGGSSPSVETAQVLYVDGNNGKQEVAVSFDIPAGKYVALSSSTNAYQNIFVYGYEV